MSRTYPGLGVELLSGRAPVDLAKGDADISIRSVRPADIDLVVAHKFELGSGVYAAVSYLSTRGRPTSAADLSEHKLVRYAEAFQHLPTFNWIEQFADPAAPAVRVDSIDMAQRLVSSGAGIGVLYCLAGDAIAGVVRLLEDPIDQMTIGIVYHESMRGSARIRAVLDLLIAYYADRRDVLSGRKPRG